MDGEHTFALSFCAMRRGSKKGLAGNRTFLKMSRCALVSFDFARGVGSLRAEGSSGFRAGGERSDLLDLLMGAMCRAQFLPIASEGA